MNISSEILMSMLAKSERLKNRTPFPHVFIFIDEQYDVILMNKFGHVSLLKLDFTDGMHVRIIFGLFLKFSLIRTLNSLNFQYTLG